LNAFWRGTVITVQKLVATTDNTITINNNDISTYISSSESDPNLKEFPVCGQKLSRG
jgi:hypothetical protein